MWCVWSQGIKTLNWLSGAGPKSMDSYPVRGSQRAAWFSFVRVLARRWRDVVQEGAYGLVAEVIT